MKVNWGEKIILCFVFLAQNNRVKKPGLEEKLKLERNCRITKQTVHKKKHKKSLNWFDEAWRQQKNSVTTDFLTVSIFPQFRGVYLQHLYNTGTRFEK